MSRLSAAVAVGMQVMVDFTVKALVLLMVKVVVVGPGWMVW